MKTIIICEQGLEECEALIVYDLLKRAGIETDLVGCEKNIISSHGLSFNVNKLLSEIDINEYGCLVLPGGMPGTKNLERNHIVSSIINEFAKENKLICAICAAPSILIKKTLLSDNEFTCYPGFECGYISTKEKVHVHNNFITSNGLGSAIDFGLEIIKAILSKDKAQEIKNKIQY